VYFSRSNQFIIMSIIEWYLDFCFVLHFAVLAKTKPNLKQLFKVPPLTICLCAVCGSKNYAAIL
jgi:hypothetical protein